jgi:hypothetical protein
MTDDTITANGAVNSPAGDVIRWLAAPGAVRE